MITFVTRTAAGRRALERHSGVHAVVADLQGLAEAAAGRADAVLAMPGAFDDLDPAAAGRWREEIRRRLAPLGVQFIDLGEAALADRPLDPGRPGYRPEGSDQCATPLH